MAYYTEALTTRPSLLERFAGFLEKVAMGSARVRELEALSALTDEQLAARGLKREEIAHYVFRDIMYL